MANAERFLIAFNRIERFLRRKNEGQYTTFSSLLEVNSNNAIINRFKVDLRELADLRNAIIHERTDPSLIIAEPHDSTVDKIERLADLIESPPLVYPNFKVNVISLKTIDPISVALTQMKEQNISQIPCYDQEMCFAGLLTERSVARWLSHRVKDDIFILSEVSIDQVLEYRETKNNVSFISKDTNIYEMQEIFFANPLIESILITENGLKNEKPIGIISLWDISSCFKQY